MNFRTLDLNLLRVFDVVMVERHVTRAAARLAITQPAVSNALRRLREATNEELFIPTSSGVVPTAHAEALWPIVRTALANLQRAFEPQAFDPREDSGLGFTVAMADATAALFVPALARRFQREGVRVGLRVVPLTTRDPREMLEQGLAEVALGFFPELPAALRAEGEALSLFRCEHLYSTAYQCVMRRDHPLAATETLSLDDYCAAEHLRVSFAGRARGFVDDALARIGRQRHVSITVNSYFTAALTVQQSDLLTVLPSSFLPAAGFGDRLAARAVPFELLGIDIGYAWHARHELDPAQRWLREALVAVAAEILALPAAGATA
ncbi:LysR family transcriptional regulator [Roseateles sp. DAIF2]|nr:LysR family transcriptional regulator [Roseateles sp. DAIF2]